MSRKQMLALAGAVTFVCLLTVFGVTLAQSRPLDLATVTNSLGVSLAPFAAGLNQPVAIAFTRAPGDTRMFVVERAGIIRIVQADGTLLPKPFLDISSTVDWQPYEEMGLLGLAFDPNYAANGDFYVYYTGPRPAGGDNLQLSRFHVSADPNVAEPTETSLLTIVHPDSVSHNGGELQFGPDGYLYVGIGDGGIKGDPANNAQHQDRLLGKLLRLDVSGVPTYTIPLSNPYVTIPNSRGEIWAMGLRNPWRFSFDRATGDLYIADVGNESWEEVDFQPASSHGKENYGWPCYEAFAQTNHSGCLPSSAFVFPIAAYSHNGSAAAVIGGYVYRGSQYPSLYGYYYYADHENGTFWAMSACTRQVASLGRLANDPSTFGEGVGGQLYVASFSDGVIYKLVGPTGPLPPPLQTPYYLPVIQNGSLCK